VTGTAERQPDGSDGLGDRAASGHVAAPPTSVMNSRRLMLDMGFPPPALK
jgi:hypothetical protein